MHQDNAGVSVARNRGLEVAKGEYICCVDADDFVEKWWLENYAEAESSCSTVPDIIRLSRSDELVEPGIVAKDKMHDWLWNVFVKAGYPWMYAVRREVANKARFPQGVAMCEDSLYATMLIPFVSISVQLRSCGYIHILHEDSAMFRPTTGEEKLRYLQALLEICQRNEDVDKSRISQMCADAVLQWIGYGIDLKAHKEIRAVWSALCERGCASLHVDIWPFHLIYAIYAHTGIVWIGRLWYRIVTNVVRLKRTIIRK